MKLRLTLGFAEHSLPAQMDVWELRLWILKREQRRTNPSEKSSFITLRLPWLTCAVESRGDGIQKGILRGQEALPLRHDGQTRKHKAKSTQERRQAHRLGRRRSTNAEIRRDMTQKTQHSQQRGAGTRHRRTVKRSTQKGERSASVTRTRLYSMSLGVLALAMFLTPFCWTQRKLRVRWFVIDCSASQWERVTEGILTILPLLFLELYHTIQTHCIITK